MMFKPVPRVFPDMPMWQAVEGTFTFVISRDDAYGGVFAASAKPAGAVPFDNKRLDLGEFTTFKDAVAACEKFKAGLQQ